MSGQDRLREALEDIRDFAWEDGKDPGRVVDALKRRAEAALASSPPEPKRVFWACDSQCVMWQDEPEEAGTVCRECGTVISEREVAIPPSPPDREETVEKMARALNLTAGQLRGLAFKDDWEEITEQERGGWRLCASAAYDALLGTQQSNGEER